MFYNFDVSFALFLSAPRSQVGLVATTNTTSQKENTFTEHFIGLFRCLSKPEIILLRKEGIYNPQNIPRHIL